VQQPQVRRRSSRIALSIALVLALALSLSISPALRYGRALSLLLSVVNAEDPTGLTHLLRHPVVARETTLALPQRTLRARVYTPQDASGRRAVRGYAMVLHGVHPDAIDEPRLQAFARALAAIGVETYTPELSELARQRILPSTIDDIGACARAVHKRVGKKPGALGISFAGGLLLLAAAREPGASSLRYVVTVGAHHDLRRVLRYYANARVEDPLGASVQGGANPYGARVMVTAYAELFFAPEDVTQGKRALESWLGGKYKQAREQAATLSARGRDRFATATEPGRRSELDAFLLEAAATKDAELLAISPAQGLPALTVPAFLVHGASDPIVPSLETAWLAREVPAKALQASLITSVLRHAELSAPPGVGEQLALVRFVASFLDEGD
jgi:pimeloyl-ACP methyl ester carboxylesterase